RESYNSLLRRIEQDCADRKLANMTARDIDALHKSWAEKGDAMAHHLITMLRGLFNFGTGKLADRGCERLSTILPAMRFKNVKRRIARLTEDQADAIISKATQMGLASIALAQALQFEFKLRQKDVIGEWVPLQSDPDESDVIDAGMKWLRGLRWEKVSGGVLHHVTSHGGKPLELELSKSCRVMAAIELVGAKQIGPMIVYERTGRPYHAQQFRSIWRNVAAAANVPRHIKNMDSRARGGPDDPVKPELTNDASTVMEDLAQPRTRH